LHPLDNLSIFLPEYTRAMLGAHHTYTAAPPPHRCGVRHACRFVAKFIAI
jgi:hypothetical protein